MASISILILLCFLSTEIDQALEINREEEGKVLIREVYPFAHANMNNEFIALYNPSNKSVDLSGWFISLDPLAHPENARRITFPWRTKIEAREQIIITENAEGYFKETGELPDFTYSPTKFRMVRIVDEYGQFKMSDKGASIALKNRWNKTIDEVVYGGTPTPLGWIGEPLTSPSRGVIIRRKEGIDTNTGGDWIEAGRMGQSRFESTKLDFNGSVVVFTSPDSSYLALKNEIRNSSESVFLNMYRFTNPGLALEIANASRRGVEIHVLLEGGPVGGMDEEERAISRVLNDTGCRVRYMVNSPSELRFCPYPFNHAKYTVIDNRSFIIHSANWDTRGVPQDPTLGNREWGVVIKNEMIAEYFSDIFLTDFNPFRTFSVAFEEFSFNSGEAGNSDGLKFENGSWNGEYDPKFFAKEITGHFSVTPLLSPDNSLGTMSELIESAEESIAIEQLYFYERLGSKTNPLIERIIDANERGVEIRVLLNFNPDYSREGVDTNERNMETVELLKECGIEARLLYTNSTPFSNLHNKGMIVDSEKVLISSINLNANGLLKNREVGVIIENEEVANYFEDVFDYDWNAASEKEGSSLAVRAVSIGIVFLLAGCLVYRSWSKK